MTPTDRFSLARHEGPYESWPLRTPLLADGATTGIEIPGYVLLHQFETSAGYVLVADFDCPYEEATTFALVSRDLRLLGCRTLSRALASFLLEGIEWIDDRRFIARFHGGFRYEVTIRHRAIPILRPRLGVRRKGPHPAA